VFRPIAINLKNNPQKNDKNEGVSQNFCSGVSLILSLRGMGYRQHFGKNYASQK